MQLNKFKLLGLPFLLVTMSCNSTVKIFGKKTPHEQYADKIENTTEGRQWINASKNSLESPHVIELPYAHAGYFPAEKARALSLEFKAKQGEKIIIDVAKKNTGNFILYADLFRRQGDDIAHIESSDTSQTQLSFDANETGTYLLRLQPELFRSAEYDLSVSIAPSLGFPVTGSKAKTGSFWGADRDGGLRKHEGIDIFAPRLTPAIAAADGYVTGVNDGGLGGKTVWMKVNDKNIHLYYAHLDKQLVEDGQQVKKGDTLGLVGNTGNAKHTPSHLHFGIYTYNGPIDPWPFVNKTIKTAPTVKAKDLDLHLQVKNIAATKSKKDITPINDELLVPLAITANSYIAEQPDGKILSIPVNSVKLVKNNKQPATLVTEKNRLATGG
jgi:murein DD-endopeptidase MepM/ murein hydrolase activator NlpD